MLLRYKDLGDNIQNGASCIGGSRLHSKIQANGTWTFSYLGDERDIRNPMPVYQ